MSYSRHSVQTAARHLARFISDDQDRIAAALCATPVVAALLTGDLAGTPIPPHFLALVALSLGFVVGHLGRICP